MDSEDTGYKRATSFDVARLAGVSRAAVSRAFTADASISPKTRAKVQAAAETLGYRVNYLARSLNGNRSDLVGVVVAALDNPFRAMQIEALAQELLKGNFRPILLPTAQAADVSDVIAQVLHYSVSGVLVTSDAPSSALCKECANRGVPVVLINKGDEIPLVDRVMSDDEAAGRMAAERLCARGARRLAVIAGMKSFSARRRADYFMAHVQSLGAMAILIVTEANNYAAGYLAAADLAGLGVEGLFCVNDYLACGVIDRLKGDRDLIALQGIAIIGHDNIPQASWDTYALTTIEQQCDVQGRQAIEMLTSRIARPQTEARISVTAVNLCARRSG